MSTFGYVYLGPQITEIVAAEEQQRAISDFAQGLGKKVDSFFTDEASSMKRPFAERKEGRKILNSVQPGDIVIVMKAEWVLGSAKEGLRLVRTFQSLSVSLYCVDLNENLSLPQERKLVVSEGGAQLIQQVLEALSSCESSKHGDSIRAAKSKMRKEGKYLGGPVPFGWRVENDYLVKDLEQQQVIQEIFKLKSDRWSYRDIASILEKKYNLKMSHEGVRRLFLNTGKNI